MTDKEIIQLGNDLAEFHNITKEKGLRMLGLELNDKNELQSCNLGDISILKKWGINCETN